MYKRQYMPISKKAKLNEDINDILAIKEGFAKCASGKYGAYDKFLAISESDRMQKILAKYELFKIVLDIPGDIVECGVHTGSGIYLYAKLLNI